MFNQHIYGLIYQKIHTKIYKVNGLRANFLKRIKNLLDIFIVKIWIASTSGNQPTHLVIIGKHVKNVKNMFIRHIYGKMTIIIEGRKEIRMISHINLIDVKHVNRVNASNHIMIIRTLMNKTIMTPI